MPAEPIATSEAPKAIGPYSQAVAVHLGRPGQRFIFCSGQIPIDPRTGELAGAGDVRAQTHRVMQNLTAVLAAAGASLAQVVKTTIYLTDLKSFALVNEAYGSYFTGAPPARATVEVAGLPRGAQVEIEAVAVVD
jgi:2-iminobutanoate/2-iminopropanoate deaminase